MLERMKIAARLLIGFGCMMFLIATLAAYSVYNSKQTQTAFHAAVRLKNDESNNERVEKYVTQARFLLWKFLATGDNADYDAAQQAFKMAQDKLAALATDATDPGLQAKAAKEQELLSRFQQKTAIYQTIKGHNENLDTSEAKEEIREAGAAAEEFSDWAEGLAQDYEQASNVAVNKSIDDIQDAVELTLGIGIISVLLGSAIAFIVSRSIAKATEEISGQVGNIQRATDTTVTAIKGIGSSIGNISEVATAVASAVQEQNAATGEISNNVQQVAVVTDEISRNINGVAEAANETGRASESVLQVSHELAKQAESLRREVDTFITALNAA